MKMLGNVNLKKYAQIIKIVFTCYFYNGFVINH